MILLSAEQHTRFYVQSHASSHYLPHTLSAYKREQFARLGTETQTKQPIVGSLGARETNSGAADLNCRPVGGSWAGTQEQLHTCARQATREPDLTLAGRTSGPTANCGSERVASIVNIAL